MNFDDITKANKGLKTTNIKGKDYVDVPQRVKAFRMLYPQGFIITDILHHDDGVVVMQAKAGYYTEDGKPVTLGTGLAYEYENSSYINKTSYIENCETSAVGRALGFLALGIDSSICSAEELMNALSHEERRAAAPVSAPADFPAVNATNSKGKTENAAEREKSAKTRVQRMADFQQATGLDTEKVKALKAEAAKKGVIPDKATKVLTDEEFDMFMAYLEAAYLEAAVALPWEVQK